MINQYKTKEDVLRKAKEAIGVPFKEFDTNNRLSKKGNKGKLGHIIEEGHFGYKINSKDEPDFKEAGVELKVTPFKKIRGGHSAKERLVLNIIKYMEEYKYTFNTSGFWKKNKSLLLMFYEHITGVPKSEYSIYKILLFEYPQEDLEIIKDDWEKIINKIRIGKAHELSEGDTLYLGACTKGATAKSSMRQQPFSDTLARQRAYSLKNSYMTYIVRQYVFGKKKSEQIITDINKLKKVTFEEYIENTVSKYYGKTQTELIKLFSLEEKSKAKNIRSLIANRMFGVKNIKNIEEFKKAGIEPKTIKVEMNGSIIQSMSFPYFKFLDIIQEEWEESALKKMFEETKFLFIIFKSSKNDTIVFERIKFWNIPIDDLEEVREVWQRTVDTIKNGVVLTKTKRGISPNLPKLKETRVAHVRPHGTNGRDQFPLPDGRMMTKQCFWLNNSYIVEQINTD